MHNACLTPKNQPTNQPTKRQIQMAIVCWVHSSNVQRHESVGPGLEPGAGNSIFSCHGHGPIYLSHGQLCCFPSLQSKKGTVRSGIWESKSGKVKYSHHAEQMPQKSDILMYTAHKAKCQQSLLLSIRDFNFYNSWFSRIQT